VPIVCEHRLSALEKLLADLIRWSGNRLAAAHHAEISPPAS